MIKSSSITHDRRTVNTSHCNEESIKSSLIPARGDRGQLRSPSEQRVSLVWGVTMTGNSRIGSNSDASMACKPLHHMGYKFSHELSGKVMNQEMRLPPKQRKISEIGLESLTKTHSEEGLVTSMTVEDLAPVSRSVGNVIPASVGMSRRRSIDVACLTLGVNIDSLPKSKEEGVPSIRRSRSNTFSFFGGDKKEKLKDNGKSSAKGNTLVVPSKDSISGRGLAGAETKMVADYLLGETIGKGRYSVVKLASHYITKEKVAVKIVSKRKLSKEDLRVLKREMQVMTLLDHPNIVKLYELTDTADHFLLILEYVKGSNLTEKVPTFTNMKRKKLEPIVRGLMRQIMSAIAYCHKGYVVHRDIKPDNVMLDNNMNVKLADWGFSNISTDLLSTHCGTPYYASPELFKPHAYSGPPSDVWACGVLLYFMYVGKLPFRQDPIREYIKKAKFVIPKSVPSPLASLIRGMLVVDPTQRLTAAEVLNHEWIQDGTPIPRPLVANSRAGLPRSTSLILEACSSQHSVIHDDVVSLMTLHLGFSVSEVTEALRCNSYNQITATYYLLRDSPKLQQFRKFLLHSSTDDSIAASSRLDAIKENGSKNHSTGDVHGMRKNSSQRKRSGSNRFLHFIFSRKNADVRRSDMLCRASEELDDTRYSTRTPETPPISKSIHASVVSPSFDGKRTSIVGANRDIGTNTAMQTNSLPRVSSDIVQRDVVVKQLRCLHRRGSYDNLGSSRRTRGDYPQPSIKYAVLGKNSVRP
eukprot:CFRG2811T1